MAALESVSMTSASNNGSVRSSVSPLTEKSRKSSTGSNENLSEPAILVDGNPATSRAAIGRISFVFIAYCISETRHSSIHYWRSVGNWALFEACVRGNRWRKKRTMGALIIVYLSIAALALSVYHSYRVLQRGQEPSAMVNAIQAGRREKRLLLAALLSALVYGSGVLLASLVREGVSFYIVLTPLVYLVVWAMPRLFLERLD